MHIVFVTNELATEKNSSGGLASFTANIARVFASYGHRVTLIFASTKEVDATFDENIDLKYFFLDKKKWDSYDRLAKWYSLFCKEDAVEIRKVIINKYKGRRIQKIIKEVNKKEKVDLVHYCNHGFYSLLHKSDIPYAVRVSGYLNIWNGGANTPNGSILFKDNPSSIYQRLDHLGLQKAENVIVPSKLLAEIGRENLGINPTVLESPFVLSDDNWDYSICEQKLENKEYVIFFGSLKYLKGVHVIGGFIEEFLKKYPEMYFVISGQDTKISIGGECTYASEYIKQCAGNYADRVIYVGRLVREKLYPVIQNAKLCVLPSRIENLSNACIEAMALGKIVIGTEGASFEQLIEDGVSGFLCERDNPESFFVGIRTALSLSDEEKREMIKCAQNVIKRLNPDNVYKQYHSFYSKIIEKK